MKNSYNGKAIPSEGKPIGYSGGELQVPDTPIIPFIEGDGTGRDIWKASRRVFDAAVEQAYGGKRRVAWFEVFAGEKAFNTFNEWLPGDTVDAIRDFRVAIKGPLTTPVGGGIRSLNVALRQILDLYSCERPVRYFTGVPSPVARSEKAARVFEQRNAEGWKEADSLGLRRGHQADFSDGNEAAGAAGYQVRAGAQKEERDAGAQGQHPKVYRGRVPRLGL